MCGLAPDINKCPNYNADTVICAANNKACAFYRISGEKNKKNQNTKEKQDGMNSIIGGREIDTLPLFRKVTNII